MATKADLIDQALARIIDRAHYAGGMPVTIAMGREFAEAAKKHGFNTALKRAVERADSYPETEKSIRDFAAQLEDEVDAVKTDRPEIPPLDTWERQDLEQAARRLGVRGWSRMSNEVLVEAIKAKQAEIEREETARMK